MRKSKITEWKCDRCGKTIESRNRILYPFGIGMTRICIDRKCIETGLYYCDRYERNKDLCSDCAKELIDIINDYFRK